MTIETTGGPAVALEERLLDLWSGINPPADGRVIHSALAKKQNRPGSDFDRAGESTLGKEAAILDVGDGQCIVLNSASNDFPPLFEVIEHDPGTRVSVVLCGKQDELRFAADQPASVVVLTNHFIVQSPLILFDGIDMPSSLNDDRDRFDECHEELSLQPGIYRITIQSWGPEHTEDYGVLAMFQRVGP